jgi:hypothetical protein
LRATLSVRAPTVARDAAAAAIRFVDHGVDACVVALGRPTEALKIALGRAPIARSNAEVPVRTCAAARSAVLRIVVEIHARRSAVAIRARRPTRLAIRLALAGDA